MKEYISPGIATKPKSAILFYKMPKSEFIETNFRIIKIKYLDPVRLQNKLSKGNEQLHND